MHGNPIAILFYVGALTMQAAEPMDPDFVRTLSGSIRGIFAVQIQRFTPQHVETEFRKAVRDPGLTSNTVFMDNLMFVVRKKNVLALRPDVQAVLNGPPLQPPVEVSALKSLYAIGADQERAFVDERFARRLFADLRSPDGVPGAVFLPNAERIGGSLTLAVLRNSLPDATARQRQAQEQVPVDHVRLGQLEQVRMSIENQVFVLSKKGSILALAQPRRDVELLKAYLSANQLEFWAYRELVRLASPATADAVRGFLDRDLDSILPRAGLPPEARAERLKDLRLRTLLLLDDLKAPLSGEERAQLENNAVGIRESPESYRPDWEEVLDD